MSAAAPSPWTHLCVFSCPPCLDSQSTAHVSRWRIDHPPLCYLPHEGDWWCFRLRRHLNTSTGIVTEISFGCLCFGLHAACHEEMAAVSPYWELCVSRCDSSPYQTCPNTPPSGFSELNYYTAWQQESRLALVTSQHTEALLDASQLDRVDVILRHNEGTKSYCAMTN